MRTVARGENTYWLQFIHRGDAGFYYDSFRAERLNLARLGTELGGEASAGVLRMCRRFHGLEENGADVLGCWPGVTSGPVYDQKNLPSSRNLYPACRL